MLRRRKAEVATGLPAKQEQVIELELNPRHRKMFSSVLAGGGFACAELTAADIGSMLE